MDKIPSLTSCNIEFSGNCLQRSTFIVEVNLPQKDNKCLNAHVVCVLVYKISCWDELGKAMKRATTRKNSAKFFSMYSDDLIVMSIIFPCRKFVYRKMFYLVLQKGSFSFKRYWKNVDT